MRRWALILIVTIFLSVSCSAPSGGGYVLVVPGDSLPLLLYLWLLPYSWWQEWGAFNTLEACRAQRDRMTQEAATIFIAPAGKVRTFKEIRPGVFQVIEGATRDKAAEKLASRFGNARCTPATG